MKSRSATPCHDLFSAARKILARHRSAQRRSQCPVTGLTKFKLQTHPHRNAARLILGIILRRLRQISKLAVIAEIERKQLRMPIQPQTANDQALEMLQEKIRQIKRARLALGEHREHRGRGEELIAVCAGYALDALLAEHVVQQSAGAAVAIGHKDRAVAIAR